MPLVVRPLARLRPLASLASVAILAACSNGVDDDRSCTESSESALKVCAAGPTVKGVDVSYYQGTVDWAAAKKAGIAFAFARAADGVTYKDTQFSRNWKVLKQDGIVRGVYQFFRPAQDPAAQADLLLQMLDDAGGLAPGDLPPVLDVETVDGVSNATLRANVATWLARVAKATGRTPIVYTALFMSPNVGTGFSKYPLWVANYGVSCPSLPDGWSGWKFWQSSSTGSVSGISGDVDVDLWNGTLDELRAYAGVVDTPPAPPPSAGDAGSASDAGAPPASVPPPDDAPVSGDAGAVVGSGNRPPPSPPGAPRPHCGS